MKPRQLINPLSMRPARGYSHVAVGGPGRMAFVAGQVALDSDLNLIGGDDLFEQSKAAMENVKTALEAVGATCADIVHSTVYTLYPTEFRVISRAIAEVQGSEIFPAQTIVGVTGLAVEGLLVEIDVTAFIP